MILFNLETMAHGSSFDGGITYYSLSSTPNVHGCWPGVPLRLMYIYKNYIRTYFMSKTKKNYI